MGSLPERKAREVLCAGDVTSNGAIRDLRAAGKALGVENFVRSGVLSLKLYRLFADHLYSAVRTPERLAQLADDPVPNRHAALHGLVVYASRQASLSALIMAEYAQLSILAVAHRMSEGGDVKLLSN